MRTTFITRLIAGYLIVTVSSLLADEGIEVVEKLNQKEIQDMVSLYKSRKVDFERDKVHLRIAEKLYKLKIYSVAIKFLSESSIFERSNLSTLRQRIILAEALYGMDKKANFPDIAKALRTVLDASRESIVKNEWQGDRIKNLQAPSAREARFPTTPAMKAEMVKLTIANSTPDILETFALLQSTAADRLGKYTLESEGEAGAIQLLKEYPDHPVATAVLKNLLVEAIASEK